MIKSDNFINFEPLKSNDMFGKLQELKNKMDEIKNRLDHIIVAGEAGSGKVKISVTGNRKIKSVEIDPSLLSGDREELEELIVVATNRALEQAEVINEAEMRSAAGGLLPNLPGLF